MLFLNSKTNEGLRQEPQSQTNILGIYANVYIYIYTQPVEQVYGDQNRQINV